MERLEQIRIKCNNVNEYLILMKELQKKDYRWPSTDNLHAVPFNSIESVIVLHSLSIPFYVQRSQYDKGVAISVIEYIDSCNIELNNARNIIWKD